MFPRCAGAVDGAFCVSPIPPPLPARSSRKTTRQTTPRKGAHSAFAWTPKRARFCEEYLVDLNAAHAAERAGFSARTAKQLGYELLLMPEIRERVELLKAERAARTEITADWVLDTAKEVVERCMQRAPVLVRRGREVVQQVDEEGRHVWQFDAVGAMKGLTLISKHTGGFSDRVEHSGPNGGPIAGTLTVRFVTPGA